MKVAIGVRMHDGPWGGGNQFAATLSRYLRDRAIEVHYALDEPDLDVLVLTEPRRSSESSAFNDVDILRYLTHVNPRAVVVHRVNECDERKNTTMVNRRLEIANRCADVTVFISKWLMDLLTPGPGRCFRPRVIQNGGDISLFRPGGRAWNGRDPIQIVTHHWSDNWMKGFDIYRRFDELLGMEPFRGRFTYTYIGNLPRGFAFQHARALPAMHGTHLAETLAAHDAYLSASLNEPAGMHHIEAALCGLPVLYRRSGALPEYCEGFGVQFDDTGFEAALLDLFTRYRFFKTRMPSYPHTGDRMCAGYLSLFEDMLEGRDEVIAERHVGSVRGAAMRAGAALYDRRYQWKIRLDTVRGRMTDRVDG